MQTMRVICAALFSALCFGASADAASFDCRAADAHVTERAICADARLSELDDQTAALYGELRSKLQSQGSSFDDVRDGQRLWVRRRDACGNDVGCIESAYSERLAALQIINGSESSSINAPEPSSATDGASTPPNSVSQPPTFQPPPVVSDQAAPPASVVDQISAKAEEATQKAEQDNGYAAGLFVAGLLILFIYMIPTAIAIMRGHGYVWVIFAVNLLIGWAGFTWIGLLVWAIWPSQKAFMDPVIDDATGTGYRTSPDVRGVAEPMQQRAYQIGSTEVNAKASALTSSNIADLERLGELLSKGVITQEEFERQKLKAMGASSQIGGNYV